MPSLLFCFTNMSKLFYFVLSSFVTQFFSISQINHKYSFTIIIIIIIAIKLVIVFILN